MHALEAEASAPGKLILMGEHAAVYGVPAVVASLGLRTLARVGPPVPGVELQLELEDFQLRESCSWPEVLEFGDRRRALWQAYEKRPSPESFSALRAGDEAGVVKIAMAETLWFLERRSKVSTRPALSLSVRSDLPVGSGFGSSAAVAVAVAAALMASLAGEQESAGAVADVALEVEKRQHGRPSGIDHTTVMRGGLLLLTRGRDALEVEELSKPGWFLDGVRVFDTGAPVESTGEVVTQVRARRERDPGRFADILDRMGAAVRVFAGALSRDRVAWPRVLAGVREFERCLEAIGVVPDAVQGAIRRVEAAGGAAKISGAGTLSGSGGGSLLVFWPPEAAGEPSSILGGYRALSAALGVEGLQSHVGGKVADVGA